MEMKEKAKDLMRRYVYDVKRHIPRSQRDEIGMEVEELIMGMMEDAAAEDGADEEKLMKDVLNKLGDPKKLAMKYTDHEGYLIGPEYYEDYMWLLKLVLGGVLIAAAVIFIINLVTRAGDSGFIFSSTVDFIINAITSTIGAFGFVTIMYAVFQHKKIGISVRDEVGGWGNLAAGKTNEGKEWNCEDLPLVPDQKYILKRSDSIVSIVFIILLYFLVYLYIYGKSVLAGFERYVIPIFNPDKLSMVLILIGASLLFSMAEEIAKLIAGRYCASVAVTKAICGTVNLIICIIMFTNPVYWNQNFVSDLARELSFIDAEVTGLVQSFTDFNFIGFILAIIIVTTIIDMVLYIYRSIQAEKSLQGNI